MPGIVIMGNCNKKKRQKFTDVMTPGLERSPCSIIHSKTALPLSSKTFLRICHASIGEQYRLEEEIGSGAFSVVYKALHLPTGQYRAAKRIRKTGEFSLSDLNELQVARSLDHPHIVHCFNFFEDSYNYYIITELCEGGKLLDRLCEFTKFSEKDVAALMRQLFSAVAYCHSLSIVHRDLKLDNIFLKDPDSLNIKLGDFGSCGLLDENSRTSGYYGTVQYMAREVMMDCEYTTTCDIWSCGVIMYVLLTGNLPYTDAMLRKAAKRVFQPKQEDLLHISSPGRDLMSLLLQIDPKKRISATVALQHEWFSTEEGKPKVNCEWVLSKIKVFSRHGKLKEAVRIFIASQQREQHSTRELEKTFEELDQDSDGKLSMDDLRAFFAGKLNENTIESELNRLMGLVDCNKSGFIDYSEFLQICMDEAIYMNEGMLELAFNQFDVSRNGYITAREIKEVLKGRVQVEDHIWADIVDEVDDIGDGKITFRRFLEFMQLK